MREGDIRPERVLFGAEAAKTRSAKIMRRWCARPTSARTRAISPPRQSGGVKAIADAL